MTNRIALILAGLLAAGIAADLVLNDGRALLFLLRKMVDLIDYVSIWR